MRKSPTDLELLEEIYRRYYEAFVSYREPTAERDSKVYMPIDVSELARHFDVDGDIIFGRLCYHLNPKFSVNTGNAAAPFFRFLAGKDAPGRHRIQFPILASAIATLREARNQFLWANWLAASSLVISIIALWRSG
ncbi:MAG TPA: hypothetical protein PLD46_05965 [Hyphomicrobium sp.]|nr:hypothetical protein [Hyphomicrobium sp.]